jgi:hypothetical protein
MRTQSRWMKWVLEEATAQQPPMPWERETRQARSEKQDQKITDRQAETA